MSSKIASKLRPTRLVFGVLLVLHALTLTTGASTVGRTSRTRQNRLTLNHDDHRPWYPPYISHLYPSGSQYIEGQRLLRIDYRRRLGLRVPTPRAPAAARQRINPRLIRSNHVNLRRKNADVKPAAGRVAAQPTQAKHPRSQKERRRLKAKRRGKGVNSTHASHGKAAVKV
ncbi:hypothetical protein DFH27DRAFT_531933 [Peziza echinospora]|nr:hypothetical protein DFH27DRAFT_531933 [Peziza echinospora]